MLFILFIYLVEIGNLGNILLVIIPAICKEKGTPFGDADLCSSYGLAYASLSMAVCFLLYIMCVRLYLYALKCINVRFQILVVVP